MAYAFFKLPCDGGADELNQFLRAHRVMTVTKQWVEAGAESFWAFCVEYRDGEAAGAGGFKPMGKIDYREVLPPAQFEVFAKLRDVRKALAEKEGLPVFAVFTNEQLAEIVRRPCTTAAQLKEIQGLGDARVEKYGPAVLTVMLAPAPPSL